MQVDRLLLTVLVTTVALAVAAATAAADTAFEADTHELAADGGRLVWSVGGGLMTGFGADAAKVPVGGGVFSGFDIGTDARGRELLVFTRCPTDLCELFSYRFADGRTRRLPFSRPDCGESVPRIHAGTIAFVRGSSRPRRGRRGCTGGLYVVRPGEPPRRILREQPWELDLGARRVAVMRRQQLQPRNGKTTFISTLHTLPLDGRGARRSIARARGSVEGTGFDGDVVRLRSRGMLLGRPILGGGFVYWQRETTVPPRAKRDDILRRGVNGGARTEALDREGRLYARQRRRRADGLIDYAVDGDSLFYSFFPAEGFTSLARLTGEPSFDRSVRPSR